MNGPAALASVKYFARRFPLVTFELESILKPPRTKHARAHSTQIDPNTRHTQGANSGEILQQGFFSSLRQQCFKTIGGFTTTKKYKSNVFYFIFSLAVENWAQNSRGGSTCYMAI